MSDKNYTLASGETFLVKRLGENQSSVTNAKEKSGQHFSNSLEKEKLSDRTTRIHFEHGKSRNAIWVYRSKGKRILSWPGGSIELDAADYSENTSSGGGALKPLKLTMPGKVLSVKVAEGDTVEAGQALVIVEAMKMENLLLSTAKAKIAKIHVSAGDRLESGTILISFEALS